MNKHRKFIIAGNWKMNRTAGESVDLAEGVVKETGDQTLVDVVLCPPFTSLQSVASAIEDSPVKLGAQNMHPAASGAYTGEISAEMLRFFYTAYVILGHSERREYFKESDAFINEKVLAAFAANLKPILCVGETLDEREAGKTLEVVETQTRGGLANVSEKDAENLVVAYEPVWAIGTGKTATPEMAQEVHAAIRSILKDLFGEEIAGKIRIQYGGSMKPSNAKELLSQPDIDGGLIGG
ncbi:MAG: triose-phosphate isomerase, partial [Verrucomicrobiae bacterium]|nr:triose-phosphate isomerase [Verrucomicrobiae bacterium]